MDQAFLGVLGYMGDALSERTLHSEPSRALKDGEALFRISAPLSCKESSVEPAEVFTARPGPIK
jgi:hypothetical protein